MQGLSCPSPRRRLRSSHGHDEWRQDHALDVQADIPDPIARGQWRELERLSPEQRRRGRLRRESPDGIELLVVQATLDHHRSPHPSLRHEVHISLVVDQTQIAAGLRATGPRHQHREDPECVVAWYRQSRDVDYHPTRPHHLRSDPHPLQGSREGLLDALDTPCIEGQDGIEMTPIVAAQQNILSPERPGQGDGLLTHQRGHVHRDPVTRAGDRDIDDEGCHSSPIRGMDDRRNAS